MPHDNFAGIHIWLDSNPLGLNQGILSRQFHEDLRAAALRCLDAATAKEFSKWQPFSVTID